MVVKYNITNTESNTILLYNKHIESVSQDAWIWATDTRKEEDQVTRPSLVIAPSVYPEGLQNSIQLATLVYKGPQ